MKLTPAPPLPPHIDEHGHHVCGFCKGKGFAFMDDPWGGVTGTCPDCFGTGLPQDLRCPQCIENPCVCEAIYGFQHPECPKMA